MDPREVVVLHEVLADELVVRLDLVHLLPRNPPLVEPVAGEALRKVAEFVGERWAVRIEVDEDQAAPRLGADGEETVVGPVELLHVAHVEDALLAFGDLGALEERRPEAGAVEAVRPAVIRAAEEALDVERAFVDELRTAVSADVVERANDSVDAADDEHGGSADREGERVAGPCHFRSGAGGDPARPEH